MNEPEEAPASFIQNQLRIDAELFKDMPRINEDTSPKRGFSRRLTLGDIAWGKCHIMTHLSTASGIDDFSYGDIMEIPDDKLLALLQYATETKLIPETQNGFMATYRTNNNTFLLRVMSDRAAEGKVMYVAGF